MAEMSIGEVAKQFGIAPSAIRYYEKVGVLPAQRRVHGRRRYGNQIFELLEIIHLAKQAGFTIPEIRVLMHGHPADTPPAECWRDLAQQKISEVEALIERAHQMQRILEQSLRCECMRLEDCPAVYAQNLSRQ